MQDLQFSHRPVSVTTAVNFSELKISKNPAETLVAFCIGSGIVVSIHDSTAGVGGLLNFILPDSSRLMTEQVTRFPYMFADTGMPVLFETLADFGAKTETMKVVIAGGAKILDQTSNFDIGHKNHQAARSILSRKNLTIHHEDIGGSYRRKLSLEIGSGCNLIEVSGQRDVCV